MKWTDLKRKRVNARRTKKLSSGAASTVIGGCKSVNNRVERCQILKKDAEVYK